ncbi:MAG TPA: LemA family protein [Gammaproteobacteria bacterium]|nr:LemA family protein [Gammaproteobacteria bacterium]
MIAWVLLGALLALLSYGVFIYNRLVRDRQRTLAGWSDIEVQLKRRHDLIPKLVDAVSQYAGYEQATLERVTALRNEAREIRDAAGQAELENGVSRGLLSVFALQEAYPDLKADSSFLQLQSDISEVESDIQHARRYYNGAVRNLNTRIESFPDLLLARLFAYRQADYFEFEETRP